MSKMVRLTDDVYQRIEELKSSGTSMSSFIEELLNQGTPAGKVSTSGDSVQLEYISQQVDAILAKMDAPSEKKSLNPAGYGGGLKKIRTPQVIDMEIARLDKDELEEVESVQDDDALLEIHSKFENKRIALREEKAEFFNNLKRS